MRLFRILGVVLVAAVVAAGVSALYYLTRPATPQVGRGPLAQVGLPEGPQNAAAKAAPSVVRIEIPEVAPSPGAPAGGGRAGSGVIVDNRGYVLTAKSLVAAASRI